MKIFRIPALSLHAAALGACYCCSSPETGRSPVYATDGLSVSSATGGRKATVGTGGGSALGSSVGGTGGKLSGGAGGNSATGGSSSGNAGGTGGGNSGGGSSVPGGSTDCRTSAGIAAMLATHGCNGCHSGQGSVTFATAADLDRIVAGAIGDAACGGMVITPGTANTSTLYLRLSGTGPATCEKMPKDASPALTATELTCLQTWLNGLQPSP